MPYFTTGFVLERDSSYVSPDPAYANKEAQLLACLTEAAQQPEDVVLLFMDKMGDYRWPVVAADWMWVCLGMGIWPKLFASHDYRF